MPRREGRNESKDSDHEAGEPAASAAAPADPAAAAEPGFRAPRASTAASEPSPRHPRRAAGGAYAHLRQNLLLLDQARTRSQFALGVGDVALEDLDLPGSYAAAFQAPGDEARLLRADWGDGSSVDLAALLGAASCDVDGAEYGPLLEDTQGAGVSSAGSAVDNAERLRRAEVRASPPHRNAHE
jgi:hypothetical protein